MMSLAHMTHGDALTNTTLSRTLPGAFTRAFISEWMHPQLPGTAESHLLGAPRARRPAPQPPVAARVPRPLHRGFHLGVDALAVAGAGGVALVGQAARV